MSPYTADLILQQADHRPWELPQSPWMMAQSWQKLLFAHWAIPADKVRPFISQGLELDCFDGMAWIGVVPFLMNHVRWRFLPPIPTTTTFPELNVRTYVTAGDKQGVWFFSLDATSQLAVISARLGFHLPYFSAKMSISQNADGWIVYDSHRIHRGAPTANFIARYRPISDVFYSEVGSFDEWLTERYCLYAADKRGTVYRCEIQHEKWRLQRAEAELSLNTMDQASQLCFPDEAPILHYADNIDVLTWLLEKI